MFNTQSSPINNFYMLESLLFKHIRNFLLYFILFKFIAKYFLNLELFLRVLFYLQRELSNKHFLNKLICLILHLVINCYQNRRLKYYWFTKIILK